MQIGNLLLRTIPRPPSVTGSRNRSTPKERGTDVFWGRLHRMILAELLKVFLVALIALTGLILLAGVISEAMKNGLSPTQILMAIPLLVPSTLPYTMPTTVLFATCIVYGRLSADNEILALKAAGVHIRHVVWPAIFLGCVAGAVTMGLSLSVTPYANYLLKTQASGDVEELLYALLRRDGCVRNPKVNYEIHVKEVRGHLLVDAIFKRRAVGGKSFDVIAVAKEAELEVDLTRNCILVHMRTCQMIQQNNLGMLDNHTWAVEIPRELSGAAGKTRPMDMTWNELGRFEEKALTEKEEIDRDLELHQAAIDLGKAESHYAEHVRHQSAERRIRVNQVLNIRSERHMRIALALGCICFALLGCPIGIWLSKGDYLSAFVTCFLPIVTIYYPMMFCMINMARAGKIEALAGIYNANGLLLVAGWVLFRRLARN